MYVYYSATTLSIVLSLVWIGGGVIVFLGWARARRAWPFAPVEVREAYLEVQRREGDQAAVEAPAAPS